MTDDPPQSYPQGYPQPSSPPYPALGKVYPTPTRPSPPPYPAEWGGGLSGTSRTSRPSQQLTALSQTLAQVGPEVGQGQTTEQRLANIEVELRAIRVLLGGQEGEALRRRARRGKGGVKINDPLVMATSFIRGQLRKDGSLPWVELVRRGAEFHHAARTMRRARSQVAVLDRKGGQYLWRLNHEEQQEWEEQQRLRESWGMAEPR